MKRVIAFLLVFILVFSSIASAAPGDIIHTGLKKIYRAGNENDLQNLLDDIISGVDVSKFYEEVEGGKYINVEEKEREQLKYLESLVVANNIKTPEALAQYLINNKASIDARFDEIESSISKTFADIPDSNKGNIDDYLGNAEALRLKTPTNYSIPIPGSKVGTILFEDLRFPTGSSKWLYRILDEPESNLVFNEEITGTDYKAYEDIEIEAGKYIGLYATDRSNRLKAYTHILIEDSMIKKAAKLVAGGSIAKGKKLAFAVSIDGIEGDWKYFLQEEKLENIFTDDSFSDATNFIHGNDILVSYEDGVIDENFKVYIYLISNDENGNIDSYYCFEVNKDLVSLPPEKLMTDTNYIGPVKGSKDETTKFEKLEFGSNSFRYKIDDDIISVPAIDSVFAGTSIVSGDEISIKAGEHLLLVAVDNEGRAKGYERFFLTEDEIKGITPGIISFTAIKGNDPGTTTVKDLILSSEANKWMYALGENLPEPVLDKVYTGSKDYSLGSDIQAKDGQTLMIFETDSAGKVKRAGQVLLNENMLKASLAYNLGKDKGAYLRDPIKGNEAGTIKFNFLRYNDLSFRFIESKDPISIPENDSIAIGNPIEFNGLATKDIRVFQSNDDRLKADDGLKHYAMIVAVDKDNKVKAYYSFDLNKDNVRLPEAEKLNQAVTNYSTPIRGDAPSSTKIVELDSTGLSKVNSFRYKIIDEEIKIEYNTIIPGATALRENESIAASLGKYLLILAVDSSGRTKYYDIIPLTSANLRSPNAALLVKGIHFSEPKPGIGNSSTIVPILKLPEGATKWMYKINDTFSPAIEANTKVDGAKDLPAGDITPVEVNKVILLLATDNEGLVKAYYNHRLLDSNVKGGPATELKENLNYVIAKGSKAGTTQFTLLDGTGLTNSTGTRWKYKLVFSVPTEIKDKPYFGSTVDGISDFFNKNADITVSQNAEGSYGYILLLATDEAGRTKGYAYIELDSANVREHADIIGASLGEGAEIDTTIVDGLTSGKKYRYIIGTRPFDTPSMGDPLPVNPKEYIIGQDIKVKFGDYLTIFELDDDGNIGRFQNFLIEANSEPKIVKQGIGELKLSVASNPPNTLLEGEINNGGKKLLITLSEGNWVSGLEKNVDLRNKLYKGLISNNQNEEWTKVINTLIDDGFGNIEVLGNNLTISLVKTSNYNITEEQEISMTIYPDLIEGAINPIYASGKIIVKPTIKANISGDVVSSIVRAEDIKVGGKTIAIDLLDGNWKINIDENKLMGGFTSTGPNWSKIKEKLEPGDINRDSSTRVTITLPKIEDFVWDSSNHEIITLKIDPSLLMDATEDIVASPTFTLYPDILKVDGKAVVDGNPTDMVLLKAPDGKEVREDSNKWRIQVTTGTLKDNLSNKDLIFTGLPKGLVATATKSEGNIIDIVVSGTSTTSISDTSVFVLINGSAVTDPNSTASNAIELKLKMAEGKKFDGVEYRIENGSIRFKGITEDMEYSSLNGQWLPGGSEVALPLEPMKVIVREKIQPKIFKEFNFTNEEAPTGVSVDSYDYSTPGEVKVVLKGVDKANMEYSKNGGGAYTSFVGEKDIILLEPNGDLRVRFKAKDGIGTAGKLPSKPTPKLNGLYLGDVVLAAGDGKILNTSANMEYSLGSNNGTDGIWEKAKAKETPIAFTVGNKAWIRDSSDIKNFRYLGTIKQADKPVLDYVDYNIGLGKIANMSNQDLEYSIAGGQWTTIWKDDVALGIVFKPGSLEFRIKAVGDILASEPVKKAPTIPAMLSAPVVEIDDVGNKVISINGMDDGKPWDIFEYRINPSSATPWNSDGNTLKTRDLSGDKVVEIRIKAQKYALPSHTGTVKFTKNLDMSHVVLSHYTNPPVLNGTTNIMEYQIVTVDSTTPWTKAVNGDTPLPSWFKDYWDNGLIISVIVRDSRAGQQANTYSVVKPEPNDDARLDKVSYKFEGDKVVFSGISSLMEYSIDSMDSIGGSWSSLDGDLDGHLEFPDEPINLYVRLENLPYVFKQFKIDRPMAPTGVSLIACDYSLDGSYAGIGISGVKENMEYSMDGGNTWKDLISSYGLEDLTKDSDLRVRYKFKDGDKDNGSLSSLPTNRLNGIHLGIVGVNADKQLLLDTTDSMEYSLDSTDGRNGTWIIATSPNTAVSLKLGDNVWIRERSNVANFRKIGVVGRESTPSLTLDYNVFYNITKKKIAHFTKDNLEYRIGEGQWISIDEKLGDSMVDLNVEFGPGNLEFRKVGNGINLASLPIRVHTFTEAEGPELSIKNDNWKDIVYLNGGGWNDIDDGLEYRVGANGEWKSGGLFKDDLIDGNTMIYFRKVASSSELHSKPTSLTLSFANLQPNVAGGKIEGTTNKMEYSINTTDGNDGTWITINSANISVNFVEGMSIWFREKDNHSMKIKLVDRLGRENKPDLTKDPYDKLTYHIGNGQIINKTGKNLEYSMDGGNNWIKINPYVHNVNFIPGLLQIRKAATATSLPSHSVVLTTIKASASGPVIEYDDVENIVKLIDGFKVDEFIGDVKAWSYYEYRTIYNGITSPWTSSEFLEGADLSGDRKLEVRKKSTLEDLASQTRVINFTNNLKLDHIRLSTNVTPFELNGTTAQMEYRIWLTNGTNHWVYEDWKICQPDGKGNTQLPIWLKKDDIHKIEIRDKNQPKNKWDIGTGLVSH